MCTLNNPCEVDADGNTTATKGQSYGQETYWFTTCLDATDAHRPDRGRLPADQARRDADPDADVRDGPGDADGDADHDPAVRREPAANPGFESGAVELDRHRRPDHQQHRPPGPHRLLEAWLGGNGSTATETVGQSGRHPRRPAPRH